MDSSRPYDSNGGLPEANGPRITIQAGNVPDGLAAFQATLPHDPKYLSRSDFDALSESEIRLGAHPTQGSAVEGVRKLVARDRIPPIPTSFVEGCSAPDNAHRLYRAG